MHHDASHYTINSSPLLPRPSQSYFSFPPHPILKHFQTMFLPHCKTPSFTPKQNNKQNYSSVLQRPKLQLNNKVAF